MSDKLSHTARIVGSPWYGVDAREYYRLHVLYPLMGSGKAHSVRSIPAAQLYPAILPGIPLRIYYIQFRNHKTGGASRNGVKSNKEMETIVGLCETFFGVRGLEKQNFSICKLLGKHFYFTRVPFHCEDWDLARQLRHELYLDQRSVTQRFHW